VPQPGRGQVEATPSVGKGADNHRPAPDFLQDALQRIVRPDLDPVAVRESVEGQGFADAVRDQLRRPGHLLAAQLGDHGFGLLLGRRAALLGMDGLQDVGNLADLG